MRRGLGHGRSRELTAAGVLLVTFVAGCPASSRRAPCDASGNPCPDLISICDHDRLHVCLYYCGVPGDCAPDEICDRTDLCQPVGTVAADATCVLAFDCVAEHVCSPGQWVDDPVSMNEVEDHDHRCRAVCPLSLISPPRPYQLNAPADDSACPVGAICVYQPFGPLAQGLGVCIPPCDPTDPSTCLAGGVCRYRECVASSLAVHCDDGSACSDGQICDSTVTPPACLSPVEFDARHPRPARSAP